MNPSQVSPRFNAPAPVTRLAVWLLCGMCLPSIGYAQVYRCTVDGKVSFSDTPCRDGHEVITAPTSPRDGIPLNPQAEANLGHVVVGQTPQQVQQAWGAPKTKRIDTDATGKTERWIYDRPGGSAMVNFTDGKVASLNEQQGPTPSANTSANPNPVAVAQAPEPSKEEIDGRERAAKAGERRFVRENTPLTEVRQRIGEPDSKEMRDAGECWYYAPTPLDSQTSTTLCFDLSGYLFRVDRKIER